MEKSKTKSSFKIWFELGALIFGTYCGANMASGAYAAGYIVTKGGGWMLVWLLMFFAFMAFFCAIGLNYVRAFKIKNYNEYYLTLWNLNRPDANKGLKVAVSTVYDIYSLCSGLITVAATIALFGTLMNTLFGIPNLAACIAGAVLFSFLTMNGAAFLRKFNSVMTISLLVCITAILIAVIGDRGAVLSERLGNFNIGADWTGTNVKAHFAMFLSYCWATSSWGSSLCNYADDVTTSKDAIGSGITIGVLVTFLFGITGLIVLPYMPEIMGDAPILSICTMYLPKVLTIVYWVVVIFSVVSTAPTFTYNMSNRWAAVWKTEKIDRRRKILVISTVYLFAALLLSRIGLMKIVQKGYVLMGQAALYIVVIPLLFTIYRVWKKDREEAGK